MKDEAVGLLFLLGSIGIIISYILLYYAGVLRRLMIIFKKSPKLLKLWYISITLTIISFIYIIIYYTFYEKLEENRTLFLISLLFFLIFAMLWSFTVFIIDKYKLNVFIQSPILLIIALSTIGLLVASVLNEVTVLTVIALVIIVCHHTIFDFIGWPLIHKTGL